LRGGAQKQGVKGKKLINGKVPKRSFLKMETQTDGTTWQTTVKAGVF